MTDLLAAMICQDQIEIILGILSSMDNYVQLLLLGK